MISASVRSAFFDNLLCDAAKILVNRKRGMASSRYSFRKLRPGVARHTRACAEVSRILYKAFC